MTMIEDAKNEIVRDEFQILSVQENIPIHKIFTEVAAGRLILPKYTKYNKTICGVGNLATSKVNLLVGGNTKQEDNAFELEKTKIGLRYGADFITNQSTGPNKIEFRRRLREEIDVPLTSIPILEAVSTTIKKEGTARIIPFEIILKTIETQLKEGMDALFLYSAVTQSVLKNLETSKRIMGLTSFPGAHVVSTMIESGEENQLNANFDYILELFHEYDAIICLGSAIRPGCILDATDHVIFEELAEMGRLVRRALNANVQIMVEAQKHAMMNLIDPIVRKRNEICLNVPNMTIGPLISDISPGYDNITSAMGATASSMIAGTIITVTPPTIQIANPGFEEIRQGVISAKIAAHIADLYKDKQQAWEKEKQMAHAKEEENWERQYELSLDPRKARLLREYSPNTVTEKCKLCGDNECLIRKMKKTF